MQKFQFIKIDSVLAKIKRDLRGLDIGETDAIEWVGEALGFMKIASASKESIAFIEVKNYQAELPQGLHYIIQIARNNNWVSNKDNENCVLEVLEEIPLEEDCKHKISHCHDCDYDNDLIAGPTLNLYYEYQHWNKYYKSHNNYSPVRLSNHSFFNSLVCKNEETDGLYCQGCDGNSEYTIVANQMRFNFEEGFIAIAYVGQMIDEDTGYPMIPDDESAKAAITYYTAWKSKEQECWNHREGACQLANKAENNWLKYIKQFKNKAKMPTGVDQHQNLMEQSKYLLPRQNRYYGFFGNLGRAEERPFADPTGRNKFTRYR